MKRLLWFMLVVPMALAADNPSKTAAKADNSRCLACHDSFEKEPFAAKHLKHNIGCENCHGVSTKHAEDDKGVTPPDVMFPKEKVNTSCWKCHDQKRTSNREDHKPVWEDIQSNTAQCTECHGKHQLKDRTVIWDKSTGKLIKKVEKK